MVFSNLDTPHFGKLGGQHIRKNGLKMPLTPVAVRVYKVTCPMASATASWGLPLIRMGALHISVNSRQKGRLYHLASSIAGVDIR
jgi:hypothetical protein